MKGAPFQGGMKKGKGLDLGEEPPRIKLYWVDSVRWLEVKLKLIKPDLS